MLPQQKLVKMMQEKKLKLAFAESMTCGLAAYQLSAVKGTDDVLQGSIVCYDEDVKKKCLKISNSLIKKFTTESQEVTDALAKNLQSIIDADAHAAITGLASDGGSERPGKPVGTVFFSVLFKNKVHTHRKLFRGSPLEIRKKACDEMFRMIQRILLKN